MCGERMFYQYQHFGLPEYFCKEYGKNFNFPKHIHRSFELITIVSGSMNVVIDDKKYTLGPKESVLIFPNQMHSLESTDCEHVLVIFSPDIVTAYYTKHTDEMPLCNKLSLSEHLISQLDMMKEQDSIVRKKGVLYSVCDAFDEQTQYEKRNCTQHELLHLIFEYIDKKYAEECSLDDLRRSLGYSASYLSRYFGNATGMSFVSFVNRYKISKACYLLKNSGNSILECSLDCGYTSLRSFNRNFRMYVGVTPREYRNSK